MRCIPQGSGRGSCPLGKSFFLQCQRRPPSLPKIPTYLHRTATLPLASLAFAQTVMISSRRFSAWTDTTVNDVGSAVSKERTRLSKGSMWGMWLKLYFALILLFVGYVTLSLYFFLDVQSEANEIRVMALNLRIVSLIKSFTHEVQAERGVSALWIAARRHDKGPVAQRGRVDAASRGLLAFIDGNLPHLDRGILRDLAVVQHFIERLPAIRGTIDALPGSPDAVVAALTCGIADSHDVVVKLATRVSLTGLAFAALAVADVLDMKEALHVQCMAFSVALSTGPLPPRSVMLLHAFAEEIDSLTENLLAKVLYLSFCLKPMFFLIQIISGSRSENYCFIAFQSLSGKLYYALDLCFGSFYFYKKSIFWGGKFILRNLIVSISAKNLLFYQVPEAQATTITAVLESNVSQAAMALNEHYKGRAGSAGTTERGVEYFEAMAAWTNELYGLLVVLLDDLLREVQAQQSAAVEKEVEISVAVAASVALALVIVATATRSIRRPFLRLHSASERLYRESESMEAHRLATGKFVPYATLELMGVPDIVNMTLRKGALRRMTVMFGDLAGFTTLSTKMVPADVLRHINAWLHLLIPHIERHGGVVDKFLGDGVMAFFHSADHAVGAGIDIVQATTEANRSRKLAGGQLLRFGLGCNSGDVYMGVLGTSERMSTVAVSQAVGVANAVEVLPPSPGPPSGPGPHGCRARATKNEPRAPLGLRMFGSRGGVRGKPRISGSVRRIPRFPFARA